MCASVGAVCMYVNIYIYIIYNIVQLHDDIKHIYDISINVRIYVILRCSTV